MWKFWGWDEEQCKGCHDKVMGIMLVHSHFGAPNHRGYPGEPNIFIHPCGNLGACLWGYRCGRRVHSCSRCSPLKVGPNLWGLSNSYDARFGTTCRVRLTRRRSSTIKITLVTTLESSLSFVNLNLRLIVLARFVLWAFVVFLVNFGFSPLQWLPELDSGSMRWAHGWLQLCLVLQCKLGNQWTPAFYDSISRCKGAGRKLSTDHVPGSRVRYQTFKACSQQQETLILLRTARSWKSPLPKMHIRCLIKMQVTMTLLRESNLVL